MSYEVRLGRHADHALRRLDRTMQERIARRLDDIAADPYGPHSKALTSAGGRRRSRVGDWRIVYDVDQAAQVVNVSIIAPRGSAYRGI